MADPADLHAAVLARLRAITSLSVHDADVPKNLPAEPNTGRVYPYLVLWPTAGHTPDDARTLGGVDGTELTWPFQVTAAGGTVTWALQAAALARGQLEDWFPPFPGAGQVHEDQTAPFIGKDEDVTPARFFVPLLFRTHTG